MIDDFVERAENNNITIITQELFHGDPIRRLENLKVLNVRIKLWFNINIQSMNQEEKVRSLSLHYAVETILHEYYFLGAIH